MRCSQAHKLINEHIDNLLERRQVIKLEHHLKKCPLCTDLFAEMDSMVKEAKRLDTFPPPEHLWPGIKKQLVGQDEKIIHPLGKRLFFNPFQHPVRLSFAAIVLIVIIIFASLYYYEFPFIQDEKNGWEMIALNHFQEAEQQYRSAIEALNRAITNQDIDLNPELAAVLNKNLDIIDDSIRACQAAIKENPDNRDLNVYLMLCYRKKIELLNEIKNLNMRQI